MRDPDTRGRLLKQSFSATKWSALVKDAGKVEEELLSEFLSAYWRPCYLFIRRDRGRSNEEAKDLTQEFIIHLFENKILDRYREELGRLRTFLKVALKNFITDRQRMAGAQRRGGGKKTSPSMNWKSTGWMGWQRRETRRMNCSTGNGPTSS